VCVCQQHCLPAQASTAPRYLAHRPPHVCTAIALPSGFTPTPCVEPAPCPAMIANISARALAMSTPRTADEYEAAYDEEDLKAKLKEKSNSLEQCVTQSADVTRARSARGARWSIMHSPSHLTFHPTSHPSNQPARAWPTRHVSSYPNEHKSGCIGVSECRVRQPVCASGGAHRNASTSNLRETPGGDAESSLGDAESSQGDANSSLGDAKSSLGDAKSSLGDADSSLGDAESSLGDAESLLGDGNSSLGDAESSLGDGKSSLGDAESSLGDAKSSLGDAKSSLGDAKSSLGDANSSLGDATSSLGGNTSLSVSLNRGRVGSATTRRMSSLLLGCVRPPGTDAEADVDVGTTPEEEAAAACTAATEYGDEKVES
jgi:hypothetical protein